MKLQSFLVVLWGPNRKYKYIYIYKNMKTLIKGSFTPVPIPFLEALRDLLAPVFNRTVPFERERDMVIHSEGESPDEERGGGGNGTWS